MARQLTSGFEIALVASSAAGQGDGRIIDGSPVLQGSVVRSGAQALSCPSGAGNNLARVRREFTGTASTYMRVYFRVTALPASTVPIFRYLISAGPVISARLTSGGKIQMWNDTGTPAQIGSDSAATIAVNTWYKLTSHLHIEVAGTDSGDLLLDDVLVADFTGVALETAFPDALEFGWIDTAPGANKTIYFDDLAINDVTGGVEDSYPPTAKVVYLRPTADAQVGSWTGGSGGTSNLYLALDNTPPVGTASESNTTQIENADATPDNSTDEYRASLTTYSAAGITSADLVSVVHPVIDHGEDAASGTKAGTVGMFSNPAGSTTAFTFGDNAGALGTWPTRWATLWGPPVYTPSVTLGTAPQIVVRKTTTSTDVASVDLLGAYVEYIEGGAAGAGILRQMMAQHGG